VSGPATNIGKAWFKKVADLFVPPALGQSGMMARVETPARMASVETGVAAATIELARISKSFQSRAGRVDALDGIDLSVRAQEFLCIIGPSGCGKSTILNIIAGLVAPSTGAASINGLDVLDARTAHQIGLVFQDAVLLPWRTVAENVELPLEVLKVPKQERRRQARQILELVKLDGFEQRFPHELSGGMRQRLGIARALSFDPQILLMDEPFGALDAITRDKMTLELLKIWEQRQKTVVFVTHSIAEAVLLSDRVVVMSPRPGRIRTIIENALPRPRTLTIRDDSRFLSMSRQLRELLEAE
jgi:NitT/TauT family transport system ATP-binding protein